MPPSYLSENLHSRVKSAIEKSALVGSKLIVAVSGGADSQALLHVLDSIKDELSLTLHGVHINHGLRGTYGDSDAQIVEEVFKNYSIPYSIESVSLKNDYHGNSSTLETIAREVRYNFFYRIVTQEKADAIVLGHTSDDQAETVLMNVLRGTGLQGLQGMKAFTKREELDHIFLLFRPLLSTTHKENLLYCKTFNIKPLEDPTNSSIIPRRNWIRNSLFKSLKKFYPKLVPSLTRLASMAQDDYKLIHTLVENEWGNVFSKSIFPSLNSHPSISLNIHYMKSLDPAIQKHLLRHAYLKLIGHLQNVTYHHIDTAMQLLMEGSGKTCFLPGAVQVVNEYDKITFYQNKNSDSNCEQTKSIDVKVPGETILSKEWSIEAYYLPNFLSAPAREDTLSACFNPSLGKTKLKIRIRVQGDRFQSLGMTQTKRLSRYFIDQKVPQNRRCCCPLLVSNDSIAWVAGLKIAEWAKVIKKKEPILMIRLKNIQSTKLN